MNPKVARVVPQERNQSGQCGLVWDKLPLGRVSDSQLARDLGVTSGAVRKARVKRGVPPFDPYRGVGLGERPDWKVIWPSDLSNFDLGLIPRFRKKRGSCTSCGARFGIDKGPLGGMKKHKAHGKCKSCYRKVR